jgi:exopolyphosphatase/guanosine-5'-triphosphate,3'-diphosphate pyrophosphatase
MKPDPIGLLEMGSNSLKFYRVSPGAGEAGAPSIETVKLPWRIAHDFFATGALSAATQDEVVARIREVESHALGLPLAGTLTVATGVFREIAELDELTARVAEAAGVRIRVISGADEAMLMARGFRELAIERPAALWDLGGATMEWATLHANDRTESGSVRLGAIRSQHRFGHLQSDRERFLAESSACCDEELAAVTVTDRPRVVATGGTALALSQVVGREVVTLAELCALVDHVLTDGPPPMLKPSRRPVFVHGLVILWRVLLRCGAGELRYGTSAVRHGMVMRLLDLLQRYSPGELHATQLLRTTQRRPP